MKSIPLCDAHAHPGSEAELLEREEQPIVTLLCASTPSEAEALFRRVKGNAGHDAASPPAISSAALIPTMPLIPTVGLHPWRADQYTVSDMLPFLRECPVIGEIGMDSVWCGTPLDIQERVFREQLALARELGKPVILHTKGQEKKIASILKEYPNTYLVHWYSCGQFLEDYLALDCYFSVGPDVWWNPAVRRVAETVPLNRLLIETDGMSAVKWAYEEAPAGLCAPDIPWMDGGDGSDGGNDSSNGRPMDSSGRSALSCAALSLASTLAETAKIRRLPLEDAGMQIYDNLVRGFLCQST